MKTDEMKKVGAWILEALKNADDESELNRIRGAVAEFAGTYPVPGIV